jgi:hypothetical protein
MRTEFQKNVGEKQFAHVTFSKTHGDPSRDVPQAPPVKPWGGEGRPAGVLIGPAFEVWNCRCTLVASMPGYDAFEGRNASKLEASYEDWKAGRDPKRAKPSGRSLKEFMGTPAVGRAASRAGMSKARVREAINDELGCQGKAARDFPSMSRAEQQEVLKRATRAELRCERELEKDTRPRSCLL